MKSDLSSGLSQDEAMEDAEVIESAQSLLPAAALVSASTALFLGGISLGGILGGIMTLPILMHLASDWKSKAEERERGQSLRKVNDSFPSVFAMVVKGESDIQDEANFLFLVIQATILLDRALVALVTEPARPLASMLIECHFQRNPRFNASALEAWAEGKVPAAMGITQMVLMGLHCGLAANREEVSAFLSTNFQPTYVDALKSMNFIRTLNTVREDFRNPSCHLSRSEFSHAEYRMLCKALLGTDDFGGWSKGKPVDLQDASILHNHLILKR